MYVVSEILSEVPRPQHWQYGVLVNHMRLLEAVLQHCSIPRERYSETATLLHRIAVSIMCERRWMSVSVCVCLCARTGSRYTVVLCVYVHQDTPELRTPL